MGRTKHVAMRTCIVTKNKLPKPKLARFVLLQDSDQVVLDTSGKIKGRGANISLSLEVFDLAVEKGAFQRAFKRKLSKEMLIELRDQFEQYIKRVELRKGQKHVTVRVQGESISIE